MIFHTVDGSGPPLLLLNGIAMSAASWQPVAEPLQRHFAVIRCDLRGQLMSPGSPPRDVGGHVDDVVEVLDHLGSDAVHVLATSFGGAVGETSVLSAAGLRFLQVCPSIFRAEGCVGSWLLSSDVTSKGLRFGYGGRPPRLGPEGLGAEADLTRIRPLCDAAPVVIPL